MIARFSIFFIFYLLQRYLPVSAADFLPAVFCSAKAAAEPALSSGFSSAVWLLSGMIEPLSKDGMFADLQQTVVRTRSFLQVAAMKNAAAAVTAALQAFVMKFWQFGSTFLHSVLLDALPAAGCPMVFAARSGMQKPRMSTFSMTFRIFAVLTLQEKALAKPVHSAR